MNNNEEKALAAAKEALSSVVMVIHSGGRISIGSECDQKVQTAMAALRDLPPAASFLNRAYEVVTHDPDCPSRTSGGDSECQCDAVPFLRDLEAFVAQSQGGQCEN